MGQRPAVTLDVNTLLRRGGEVLLIRRNRTGYFDGWLHVPAGHVEQGEDACTAAVREVEEEVGVRVRREDMNLVTIIHRNENGSRISLFFQADRWEGEVSNCEPHKCDEILWTPVHDLPETLVCYVRCAIENAERGKRFEGIGWT